MNMDSAVPAKSSTTTAATGMMANFPMAE